MRDEPFFNIIPFLCRFIFARCRSLNCSICTGVAPAARCQSVAQAVAEDVLALQIRWGVGQVHGHDASRSWGCPDGQCLPKKAQCKSPSRGKSQCHAHLPTWHLPRPLCGCQWTQVFFSCQWSSCAVPIADIGGTSCWITWITAVWCCPGPVHYFDNGVRATVCMTSRLVDWLRFVSCGQCMQDLREGNIRNEGNMVDWNKELCLFLVVHDTLWNPCQLNVASAWLQPIAEVNFYPIVSAQLHTCLKLVLQQCAG